MHLSKDFLKFAHASHLIIRVYLEFKIDFNTSLILPFKERVSSKFLFSLQEIRQINTSVIITNTLHMWWIGINLKKQKALQYSFKYVHVKISQHIQSQVHKNITVIL